jgi:DNA polymerase/3'-5' exonuclease PolX
MNLVEADAIAERALAILRPLCHRVEVAGSVRRRKPTDIKDVELVILPNPALLRELAEVINNSFGHPQQGRFPSKYVKIRGRFNLDIFVATKENWGLIYFIRTGSANFAQSALAHWKKISNGGYSENGVLHQADGTPVPTPEESDVFAALKCKFIPPRERFRRE